jgi:hypothetical protein
MPFVAEFSTDGRSKMLDSGHAPDQDKDRLARFPCPVLCWAKSIGDRERKCR